MGRIASIEDDTELLDLMLADQNSLPAMYRPGPYWEGLCASAARQIRARGLSDFRGSSNTIGLGFTDCTYLEATAFPPSLMGRLMRGFISQTPISRLLNEQVRLTRTYWRETLLFRNDLLSVSTRAIDLIARYNVEDSISAGCLDTVEIGSKLYAHGYLLVLDRHDRLTEHLDYTSGSSVLEIGGGFGTYVHLLANNYPNLRKFLYLDIPPNLYVGTQYLKSLFGSAVRSYRETRDSDVIEFNQDDDLEILCIAPHQLERFRGTVDYVNNANSFVEMPKVAVANYARLSERLLAPSGRITLISYNDVDRTTTFDPNEIQDFFTIPFRTYTYPTLRHSHFDHHYISEPLEG